MLLTEEIDVGLIPKNIPYYEGTDDEYRVLSYKGKHYFWLDEYESMSKEEVQEIVQSMIDCNPKEKVVCVTTGKVFDSMTDGATYYNRGKNGKNGISACCRRKQKYSGKLPDGTPLLWMYLSDYKKCQKKMLQNGVKKQ